MLKLLCLRRLRNHVTLLGPRQAKPPTDFQDVAAACAAQQRQRSAELAVAEGTQRQRDARFFPFTEGLSLLHLHNLRLPGQKKRKRKASPVLFLPAQHQQRRRTPLRRQKCIDVKILRKFKLPACFVPVGAASLCTRPRRSRSTRGRTFPSHS